MFSDSFKKCCSLLHGNKLQYVNVIGQNLLRTQTFFKKNEEAVTIENIVFLHGQYVYNMAIHSKLLASHKLFGQIIVCYRMKY